MTTKKVQKHCSNGCERMVKLQLRHKSSCCETRFGHLGMTGAAPHEGRNPATKQAMGQKETPSVCPFSFYQYGVLDLQDVCHQTLSNPVLKMHLAK